LIGVQVFFIHTLFPWIGPITLAFRYYRLGVGEVSVNFKQLIVIISLLHVKIRFDLLFLIMFVFETLVVEVQHRYNGCIREEEAKV
jgi:hypothetical protein